jgi:hypothetical protein
MKLITIVVMVLALGACSSNSSSTTVAKSPCQQAKDKVSELEAQEDVPRSQVGDWVANHEAAKAERVVACGK